MRCVGLLACLAGLLLPIQPSVANERVSIGFGSGMYAVSDSGDTRLIAAGRLIDWTWYAPGEGVHEEPEREVCIRVEKPGFVIQGCSSASILEIAPDVSHGRSAGTIRSDVFVEDGDRPDHQTDVAFVAAVQSEADTCEGVEFDDPGSDGFPGAGVWAGRSASGVISVEAVEIGTIAANTDSGGACLQRGLAAASAS